MPCQTIKFGNKTAILCGGRGKRQKPCFYCGRIDVDEILCDFPIRKYKNGKWKTCDRLMCSDCTQKGVSENVDFCRQHYPIAKAAYVRRQVRKIKL